MNLDNTKEAAQMLQSSTFAGPQQDTTLEVYFSCLPKMKRIPFNYSINATRHDISYKNNGY